MPQPSAQISAFPSDRAAFLHLRAYMHLKAHQLGEDKILSAAILSRITPLFQDFKARTSAWHVRTPVYRKKNQSETPEHDDYFVFCTGMSRHETLAYRFVRITSRQYLSVLDVDRLLDNTELHAAGLGDFANSIDKRIDMMAQKGIESLRRYNRQNSEWVQDLNFVVRPGKTEFQDFSRVHRRYAADMMKALNDLVPTELQKDLRTQIEQDLADFSAKRAQEHISLLQKAKFLLNAEIVNLITRNKSEPEIADYMWLTENREFKYPEKKKLRRAIIERCPVILSIDQYADAQIAPGCTLSNIDKGDPDTIISMFFGTHFATRFSTSAERFLPFYKSLTESGMGQENAKNLLTFVSYIQRMPETALLPETPEDWTQLGKVIDFAEDLDQALQIPGYSTFSRLMRDGSEKTASIIGRHYGDPHFWRGSRKREVEAWKRRFGHSVLTTNFLNAAKAEAGIFVPIPHAIALVTGDHGFLNKKNGRLPKNKNGWSTDYPPAMSDIVSKIELPDMLEDSMRFAMKNGDWDRILRNLFITNRLDENGDAWHWFPLPTKYLPKSELSIVGMTSQADMLKDARRTLSDIWMRSAEAITSDLHFVSIRKGIMILGTAILGDPIDERWPIRTIIPTESGNAIGRNNMRAMLEGAMEEYVQLLGGVDLPAIKRRRMELRAQLPMRIKDHEIIGINPYDFDESRTLAQLFMPYVSLPDVSINAHGCISSPLIDEKIDRLVRDTVPFFAQYRQDPARGLSI